MKSVSIVQFCFTGACLFFCLLQKRSFHKQQYSSRWWWTLYVSDSVSMWESVTMLGFCFLFRQVHPHVSCLSYIQLIVLMSVTCQTPVCLFIVFHLRLSSRRFVWFGFVFFLVLFFLIRFFKRLPFVPLFSLSAVGSCFAVCSIIRQHTLTSLCLHLFFKHLPFAFLVVWARRILLFYQNSWGYWADKWSLYFLWIHLFISKRNNVFHFFQRVHNFTLMWELCKYLMSTENLCTSFSTLLETSHIQSYVFISDHSFLFHFSLWTPRADSPELTWAHLSSPELSAFVDPDLLEATKCSCVCTNSHTEQRAPCDGSDGILFPEYALVKDSVPN